MKFRGDGGSRTLRSGTDIVPCSYISGAACLPLRNFAHIVAPRPASPIAVCSGRHPVCPERPACICLVSLTAHHCGIIVRTEGLEPPPPNRVPANRTASASPVSPRCPVKQLKTITTRITAGLYPIEIEVFFGHLPCSIAIGTGLLVQGIIPKPSIKGDIISLVNGQLNIIAFLIFPNPKDAFALTSRAFTPFHCSSSHILYDTKPAQPQVQAPRGSRISGARTRPKLMCSPAPRPLSGKITPQAPTWLT